MKDTRAFWGALVACFAIVFSGCQNPFRPYCEPANEATGTLLLTINGTDTERTILPTMPPESNFPRFNLAFTPNAYCDAGNTGFVLENWNRNNYDAVVLATGIWNLTVTAFLDDAGHRPAARGTPGGAIAISPGQSTPVNVVLLPITDGYDYGAFSWEIRFPEVEGVYRAVLRIEHIDDGGYVYSRPFNDITPSHHVLTGSHDLPVGVYRVIFTLHKTLNGRAESGTVSATLHISGNLESRFEGEDATFTPADFPVSLLNFVLDTWDGYRWNLIAKGITARHFDFLGIDGVTAGNFAQFVPWLDRLTYYFDAPTDLPWLQTLADAALVGVDENAVLVLRDGLAEQLAWLRENAVDNTGYIIELSSDEYISPAYTGLPTGRIGVTVTIRGNLEGDGNMRTVSLSANGSLFTVRGWLVLGNNINLQGRPYNNNPLVRVLWGGNLVMNAGSRIMRNTTGVYVGSDGTFTMYGGVISGNTGSGVTIIHGTFNMLGGVISDNTGSGVRVELADGSFTMYGGEISGNNHSGVSIAEALFTMNGGVISNNATSGVNIFTATFFMNGGVISGNIGTGVHNNASFFMSNGVIYGNDAEEWLRNEGGALVNIDSVDAWWGPAIAHFGTFSNGTFTRNGDLTTTDYTIEVINGQLLVTVAFNANGDTGLVPEPSRRFAGEEIELPALGDLNRDGYWFAMRGWSTNPDTTVPEFLPGEMFTVGTNNVTLHIVWPYGFAFDNGAITSFSGGSTGIVIPSVINGVAVTAISSVWPGVFENRSLASVYIPSSVTYIGLWAFGNNQLTEIVIPYGVTHIGQWAFGNNNLTEIVIPHGVTHIGDSAFAGNQPTLIVIPEGVTSFGDYVFSGSRLTSIVISNDIISLGGYMFAHSSLISIVILEGVTDIGIGAFLGNQLTSAVIPNSVTQIGRHAFAYNQLISVVLEEGVTSIGHQAFIGNQLTSLVIPDSVTHIWDGAFGESQLISITIPSNVYIQSADFGSHDRHTMGTHGESFLTFYNSTGQRAGTYTWDGTRWVFGGEGGFTLSFTGFTDAAGGVEAEYTTVSILAAPANITVVGSFDPPVRWIHNGEAVPGTYGATLDFSTLHGNRIGIHHVTVEVNIGERWYSRHIRINVTR